MTQRIVAIAAVLAIVSVSTPVAAQQRPYRLSDQQVKDLVSRIDTRTDAFGASFDRAVDRPAGNFLVPGGTRVMVTLDTAVSSERARHGDRLTMTTRNPSRYEGAVIEAFVSSVNASGRLGGRADLALVFESIRLRDGRTFQFAGVIENVRTPDGEAISVDNEGTVEEENSQTEKTVQRGAIGVVIGAGGGAGSVIVEGRDQLDLPRGTELTIISSTPRRPAESTGAQR